MVRNSRTGLCSPMRQRSVRNYAIDPAVAQTVVFSNTARADPMRGLAYRLHTLCERKGGAEEARAYNELVTTRSSIEQTAGEAGMVVSPAQLDI